MLITLKFCGIIKALNILKTIFLATHKLITKHLIEAVSTLYTQKKN